MPKASPIQSSFNGGEFSDLLKGQIGLEKRREALEICQNIIPLKQGAATRRAGTTFINQVKSAGTINPFSELGDKVVLIPFKYSTEDTYLIELGDLYLRFYKNDEIITDSSTSKTPVAISQTNPVVVTYSGSDDYSNGDSIYFKNIRGMYEITNKTFRVANLDTGAKTFEIHNINDVLGNGIDGTNFSAYSGLGTMSAVYELSAPYRSYAGFGSDLYDQENISRFDYVQSADVLYIFHQAYQTRTITRLADDDWSINTLVYEDGPYLDTNTTSTTLSLSSTSGTVTVTASSTTGINNDHGFYEEDIGRIIRWQDPANNWTWLTITAFSSTTQVTARIDGDNASATTATVNWRLGVWSDTTGWPAHGTFFQDRLCFGGGRYEFLDGQTPNPDPSANRKIPDRIDLSKTGGYSSTFVLMAPTEVDGAVSNDNAISKTLPAREVNAIQWMVPDSQGLIIGTTSQEWTLRASSGNEVMTPENARPELLSSYGNAAIRPVLAESGIVACNRARRRIFDMLYSFDLDKLKPRDVTLAAEHITRTQIIQLAYQQDPINVVWAIRTDGTLLSFTYYPEEKVFAWARHIIGGVSDSNDTQAKVISMAVIPSTDGSKDELWLQIQRYIDGNTVYYIEKLNSFYEDDVALETYVQQDCSYSYPPSSLYSYPTTNIINGLFHLEGETVQLMIDGKAHNDRTVTNGSVSLENGLVATNIQLGYKNTWIIKTLEVEAGSADGTAQGKTKRIHNIAFKLLNTLGFKYGSNSSNLDEYDFDNYKSHDETPVLFSGNTEMTSFPGGYEQEGQVYLTSDSVFPMTLLAIIMQLHTQDR